MLPGIGIGMGIDIGLGIGIGIDCVLIPQTSECNMQKLAAKLIEKLKSTIDAKWS